MSHMPCLFGDTNWVDKGSGNHFRLAKRYLHGVVAPWDRLTAIS
jgi:hypothetical protein